MTSLSGRKLGRYILHEELGRGGMARVYRATDTTLQRTVALKLLAPQLSMDQEFSQRFEREAVTAANLRHANIVTIFDIGEAEGFHYIAMEYISGRTLHAILEERRRFPLGATVAILDPVARALDYAHSQGAVHRDIKPHNIMIDTDGRVVLMDFGIAQNAESGERLTRTGSFMGTPEYISPEQASGQPVDGRSDLYSLGIVGFEMLTGTVPFTGPPPQLIIAHVYNQPPAPSTMTSGIPPEIDQIFARVLAKQPSERYAAATGFSGALRAVAQAHNSPIPRQDQLAVLAVARDSSAGQSTVPMAVPQQRPPTQPMGDQATAPGAYQRPPVAQPLPQQTMPQRPQPQQRPPQPQPQGRAVPPTYLDPDRMAAGGGGGYVRPRRPAPPRDEGGGAQRWAIAAIAVLFIMLIFFVTRDQIFGTDPEPTPTGGLTGDVVLRTATPTRIVTVTPMPPTPEPGTTVPTAEPTVTPEPATPTPESATAEPSATPEPATAEPSATPEPATPTPEPATVTPTVIFSTATPTSAPSTATPTPTPTVEAALPVDNDLIFFRPAASGGILQRMSPDGTIEPIATLNNASPPLALSPDESLIAYVNNSDATPVVEIHKLDGNTVTTIPAESTSPAWSESGKQLAFVTTSGGVTNIAIVNEKGEKLQTLTTNTDPNVILKDPTWSNDQIVYVRESKDGSELWSVSAKGKDERFIIAAPLGYSISQPDVDPDETAVALIYQQSGVPGTNMGLLDLDTGLIARVNTVVTANEPAWSPDGEWIAYYTGEGISTELWIVNRNGNGAKLITDGGWPMWAE